MYHLETSVPYNDFIPPAMHYNMGTEPFTRHNNIPLYKSFYDKALYVFSFGPLIYYNMGNTLGPCINNLSLNNNISNINNNGKDAYNHYNTKFIKKIVYKIPKVICNEYKACGTIVVSRHPITRKIMILLGKEDRTKRIGKHRTPLGIFWLNFQGKREIEDNNRPERTAFREFMEETGKIFSDHNCGIISQLYDINTPKIWFSKSKYVLFFVVIPFDDNVSDKFLNMDKNNLSNMYQLDLQWFELYELLEDFDTKENIIKIGNKMDTIYPFFKNILLSYEVRYIFTNNMLHI